MSFHGNHLLDGHESSRKRKGYNDDVDLSDIEGPGPFDVAEEKKIVITHRPNTKGNWIYDKFKKKGGDMDSS